jgi:hypothetical protein
MELGKGSGAKMLKIDHRKTLKHLYNPSRKKPVLVDVPPLKFLTLDGRGKPDGLEFQQAASTLFPLAYTLKFMLRSACNVDFHVMPMEVRWRVNREKKDFAWTMMLMQPEYVTPEWVAKARQQVSHKVDTAMLDQVRFVTFAEGMCVQFLHVGPYTGMDSALESMCTVAERERYTIPARNAHDIYLNDVRKTKPENLKAVMRLQITRNP